MGDRLGKILPNECNGRKNTRIAQSELWQPRGVKRVPDGDGEDEWVVAQDRIELSTPRFSVACSTN